MTPSLNLPPWIRLFVTTLTLSGLVIAAPVDAQGGGAHTKAVLAGGVSLAGGGPATSGGAGLSGHIGLRHQRGRYLFSARAGMNGGGSAPFEGAGRLIDRFDELAVLVGYAVAGGEKGQVVLSAGLAAVSGERVEQGEGGGRQAVDFATTVGVPLQLAVSAPGPGSGFGLVVHANLNPEEIFGAVVATYLIGF